MLHTMGKMLIPSRSTQRELLDAPIVNRAELAANLADIRAVNRWLGGSATVVQAIAPLCRKLHGEITLLDVATGSADIPFAVQSWGLRRGIPLHIYASDLLMDVLHEAYYHTQGTIPLMCLNGLHLPYRDKQFDIVTCVHGLHHFQPESAVALLRELSRVARHALIVSDLKRSWLNYVGAHLLGMIQRSAISRHDGPLSVLRAYTPHEAMTLAKRAGINAQVYSHMVHMTLIAHR